VRSQAHSTQTPKSEKPPDLQDGKEMARPGLEPGTPRFSGTGNLCRKRQKRPANRLVDDCVCSTSIPVVAGSCLRLKDVAPAPRPFRPVQEDARSQTAFMPLREPGIEFSNPTGSRASAGCRAL
jgi:hypothetical protein